MSKVTQKKKKEEAARAINKLDSLGEDIDLKTYSLESESFPYEPDLSRFSPSVKERMLEVGIVPETSKRRGGAFVQINHSPVHSQASQDGLEVMSSSEALKKYDWLADYWWQAVAVDSDKFTAQTELYQHHGYFIRTLPGVKTIYPVQACLYIAQPGIAQNVHNVIIAEENSELHIITGCTVGTKVFSGLHIGISEFYVKKNAKVTFTMIHNWAPEMVVRPRSGAIVEEGGIFLSNYICMKPVLSLQSYPTTRCIGKNSFARFSNVLIALPSSKMDVGSCVILAGEGARAEIIARAISTGGKIISRGQLVGQVPGVKGHLECRGLILANEGNIQAVPELLGSVAGVDLSHEAAIGRIAEEELEYLMARGLNQAEATAFIVRGFLKVDIEGLPSQLALQLQQAIEASEKEII